MGSFEKLCWEGFQVAEEWLNERGGIVGLPGPVDVPERTGVATEQLQPADLLGEVDVDVGVDEAVPRVVGDCTRSAVWVDSRRWNSGCIGRAGDYNGSGDDFG